MEQQASGSASASANPTISSLILPANMPRSMIFDSLRCARRPILVNKTGSVYRGARLTDGNNQSEVAIKKATKDNPRYNSMLQTELNCLFKVLLDNPNRYPRNVIGFHGVRSERIFNGVTRRHNEVYKGLVVSYVSGGNVYDKLHQEIPSKISWETRVKIIRGTIKGLKAIKRSGYVFQDLNTQCISIDQDGRGILTEFGSVCVPGKPNDYRPFFGGYTDPDYFNGLGAPQHHHQVYSLGVVILEIILGKDARIRGPMTENLAQEYEKADVLNVRADRRMGTQMANEVNKNQFYTLFKVANCCCLPKEERISLERAEELIDALFID